jgi:hypothetical protein
MQKKNDTPLPPYPAKRTTKQKNTKEKTTMYKTYT